MHNKKSYLKSHILGIVFAILFLLSTSHLAILSAAYNSVNVLGQTDGAGGADYVGGSINDGITANGYFGILNPGGTALDITGQRIFIADTNANRILVFNTDSNGVPLDYLADAVLGQTGFLTSTSGTTAATLSGPQDIEFDPYRNYLYVADSGNNRVLVFDVSSVTTGQSAIKVLGQANLTSGSSSLSSTRMNAPLGLDLLRTGSRDYLFVADSENNRVLAFDLDTNASGVTTGEAASEVLGQGDFDSGTDALGEARLSTPMDVSTIYVGATKYLFVADYLNNRVVGYDIATITTGEAGIFFMGQVDGDTADFTCEQGDGLFCGPSSVEVQGQEANSTLWVSDSVHNRVVGIDIGTLNPSPEPVVFANVFGYTAFDGSQQGSTYFTSVPGYLYFDPTRNDLFVSGTNDARVVVFGVSGSIENGAAANDSYGQIINSTTPDLESTTTPSPFGNHISSTGLDMRSTSAHSVVDTVNHRLFVSDTNNNRVLVYNLTSSNLPIDRTADYVLGQASFSANATATSATGLAEPTGLAFLDRISSQELYVSDMRNNRVIVYDITAITNGESAIHVLGQLDFTTSDARLDDMGLTTPGGLDVVDVPSANDIFLFVADTGSNRVLSYSVKLVTDGETATAVIGQSNFVSSSSGTTATSMDEPYDVEADIISGRLDLFVSDGGNSRVTYFTFDGAPTSNKPASAVIGQGIVTQEPSPEPLSPTAAIFGQVTGPRGLDLNTNNNILYISDPENNRVLGFDVESVLNGESAVSVFGQDSFTSSTAGTTSSTFDTATGVFIDSTNNKFYVTDTGNNRVLVYSLPFVTQSTLARTSWANTTANSQGTLSATYSTGVYPPGYKESTSIPGFEGFVTLNGTYSLLTQVIDTLGSVSGAFYANKITLSGTISAPTEIASVGQTDAFTSRVDFGGYTGATNSVAIGYPEAIELDTTNNRLFVADTYNNRIMVFNLNSGTGKIDNYTPDYYLGQSNSSNVAAATTQSGLNSPTGMVFDSSSNYLYVADSGNNRVITYNTSSLSTGMNASYVLGQTLYTTSTIATTQSGLRFPQGLEIDTTADKLFVSDTGNNRVLVYDVASITNGENAEYVLGQGSFTARVYATSDANDIASPTELEFDQSNKLLYVLNEISASNSGRILRYDTNTISNNENATQLISDDSNYYGAHGLALDTENETLYFSVNDPLGGGSGQDVVYGMDMSVLTDSTEDITPISIIGDTSVSLFDGDVNDRTSSRMYEPRDMVMNSDTRELYVLDSGNKRVMVFDLVEITTSSLSSGTEDAAYSVNLTSINNQNNLVYRGENVAYAASDATQDSDLPPGITLSSTGVLSGTPTTPGTYTFTVRAYDTSNALSVGNVWPLLWDKQTYSLTINTASAPSTECNDSADNDGNGLTDWPSDPGCENANDDDESSPTGGGSPSACSDDLDNDTDELTDWPNDPGCENANDDSEFNSTYQCNDGEDNDNDGFVDYPDDSSCENSEDDIEFTPQCSDGIDNDSDGRTDWPNDLGCENADDNTESGDTVSPTIYECSDGIDNDDNELTDWPNDSTGCSSMLDPDEYTAPVVRPVCNDGEDNDNDELTDWPNDPGCENANDPSELNVIVTPVDENPPPDPIDEEPVDEEIPDENPPPEDEGGCFGEITSETPFGEVVITQIEGTLCEVLEVFEETTDFVDSVLKSPQSNLFAKIFAVVGLVMGAVFTVVPYLFLTPFSFAEVALLPYRLWSLLMSIFGLKKRVRPWGTVYDAITKQPLDPAVVELLDLEGRPVATSTTDIDGRYGFLVGPGKYRLLPKKTHYAFPSLKMIGKTRDELYLDLYFGYVFEITREGEVITKNIPMDPERFDWNEFAKNQQKKMRFYSKRDFVITKIADYVFSIGFVVAILALITAPSIYNIIIFLLYVVTLILREIGIKHSSFGQVKDLKGNPLSFAIIRVKFADGTEVAHKVTNEVGRFYCLLQNGTYIVSVERKNQDESYTKIYEQVHQVKKGVLKETIIVQ